MRGSLEPTTKRSEQCKDCGRYFAPAGLIGHRLFVHQKRFIKPEPELNPLEEFILIKRAMIRAELQKAALRELRRTGKLGQEVLDGILEMMLMDYLFERGPFKPSK